MATEKDSISVRIAKNIGKETYTHYKDCIEYIDNFGEMGYNSPELYNYCMGVDCPEVRAKVETKDRIKKVKRIVRKELEDYDEENTEEFLNFMESIIHKRSLPDNIEWAKSEIKFCISERKDYKYKYYTKKKQDENEAGLIQWQEHLKELQLEYKKILLQEKTQIEKLLNDKELKYIDENEENIVIEETTIEDVYKQLDELEDDKELYLF